MFAIAEDCRHLNKNNGGGLTNWDVNNLSSVYLSIVILCVEQAADTVLT